MTHRDIIMSMDDFLSLLHRFKTKCYNGEYDKIQYSVWRDLNRYTSGKVVIRLYVNNDIQINILNDNNSLIISYGFDKDDNSFGSFLLKEMNWDEFDKLMYNTYNSSLNNEITYDLDSSKSIATIGLIDDINHLNKTVSSSCDWYYTGDLNCKVDKSDFDTLAAKVDEIMIHQTAATKTTTVNDKENNNMKNFNFDFGPMNGNVVRMSMYGLAVKDKTGSYVSYDAKNGEIMNVDIINFDGADFLYKMPVAIKDISIGDIVIHQNVPMFVVDVSKDNKALVAIDPVVGERKEIMLARSPFGFNFATKVVNLLGNAFGTAASADNPFGNMWMLLAMNEGSDMSTMLPMMMFAQGGTADPTMAMAMMAMSQKDGKTNMSSILPMMWMMNNTKPAAPCTCGCHKDA